eukprot:3948258-Prorocentrum_lima.AAC.1
MTDPLTFFEKLRGVFGLQSMRLQPDNVGAFINHTLINGCQHRGACMAQTPPYQPKPTEASSEWRML